MSTPPTSPTSPPPRSGPLSAALRTLWAIALIALSGKLAVDAFSPLARSWDLVDSAQPGQLTIFNAKPGGGSYGHPVEIGDYDNDGFPDLVMAPMGADAGADEAPREDAGEVYVYKGDGVLAGTLDRAVGLGRDGVTLWGARAGDLLGTEVFTADINGDGVEDVIVGAQNYDGVADGCSRENCGGIFVLFGREGLLDGKTTIDLATIGGATPPDGLLTIVGAGRGHRLGIWVEAGDLDGDGIDDLILGADQAQASDPNAPRFHSGLVRVIYGRTEFPAVIDMATDVKVVDGITTLLGRDKQDHFGASLHSRDLNRDGRDELIVASALNRLSATRRGAACDPELEQPSAIGSGGGDGSTNQTSDAGEVYVFFGPPQGGRLPVEIDLSQPLDEAATGPMTTIYGDGVADAMGEEIATGDFNGDGYNDLALGALTARNPDGVSQAGKTYVVYWRPDLEGLTIDFANPGVGTPADLEISTMYGLNRTDIFGDTLSAADFNNDGYDDLAVAAPHAKEKDLPQAGVVAVVLGSPDAWPELWAPQAPELPPGLQVAFVLGADAFDLMSYSMEARDYDGDGYADLFPNAMHGSGQDNGSPETGDAHIVSGYHLFGTTLQVREVDPPGGPLGTPTTVQIRGTGFTRTGDTRILVEGTEVENVRVLDGTLLEFEMPTRETFGPVSLRVETRHAATTAPAAFTYFEPEIFLRGDSSMDRSLELTDAVLTLNFLFLGGATLTCADAADADDDGAVGLNDAVYTLNHLFLGGPAPAAPYPDFGMDPTGDTLLCK